MEPKCLLVFKRARHCTLSWGRRIQSMLSKPRYFRKINFNIILINTPRLSELTLPFTLPNQNLVCTYYLPISVTSDFRSFFFFFFGLESSQTNCRSLRLCVITFRNMMGFTVGSCPQPNLQAEGQPIVGCPRLTCSIIYSCSLHTSRPFFCIRNLRTCRTVKTRGPAILNDTDQGFSNFSAGVPLYVI
jgi:hypothetical protein